MSDAPNQCLILKIHAVAEQSTPCNHSHCTTRANDITNNQTSHPPTNRCGNLLTLTSGRDSSDICHTVVVTNPFSQRHLWGSRDVTRNRSMVIGVFDQIVLTNYCSDTFSRDLKQIIRVTPLPLRRCSKAGRNSQTVEEVINISSTCR